MPWADVLIESVGMARYLSTLDLTKGYWQVPLRPPGKEKTAFATPSGLYKFKVMPFGLHGAPAMFQRLMDTLLGDCTSFSLAYLDDIIIFSPSWEQHLQTVLHHLQQAGLRINRTKSKLAFEELLYLGYLVGHVVLRPQHKRSRLSRPPLPPQPKDTYASSWAWPCIIVGLFWTLPPWLGLSRPA